MIKLFRIDERLIHGQIAIKWSRHTGVDSIVVANDHAAENVMIQKSLKMAAPPGIKTVIKTLDAAIATLNDPRCEPLKVLVLVNSPADALKMVRAVKGIPFVNIGTTAGWPRKSPAGSETATTTTCTVTQTRWHSLRSSWAAAWTAFIRHPRKSRQSL